MKSLLHKARGVITLTVTGVEPERFLNRCARQGVFFWGSEPVDPLTIRVKLHARDLPAARAAAEKLMCQLQVEREEGAPLVLRRLRRRGGFLAGMTLSLLAAALLSQVILVVRVEGNVRVPTAVILTQLRRQGLRPGAFAPLLDEGAMAQQALVELEELAWMAINLKGTRANVLVRERVEKPALENAAQPADVVAGATGILTHVETWQGRALVREGDTVVAGDVVISGWMPIEPPEYSGLGELGGRAVRAEGRVEGRTWRSLTAVLPVHSQVKSPTGRETRRFSLCILGKRLNFYRNSGISFGEYDKMTQVRSLTLPGGAELPVCLVEETLREVERFSTQIDRAGAAALLEQDLRRDLAALIGDGEVTACQVSAGEERGLWRVCLQAQCLEEIGRTVEWPPGQTDGA